MNRTITFQGIENARQLGGLVMQDGRTVRKDTLLRCGNLSHATDADVLVLTDRFHLTDVFDFRFEAEVETDPDRRIGGVNYTSLSTLPREMIEGFSTGNSNFGKISAKDVASEFVRFASIPQAQALARRLYPSIVMDPQSQKYYGDFLRGVLNARGGSLWHCSQGKDRAGLAAAFLLTSLGAGKDTVIEDFSQSNVYYAPLVDAISEQVRMVGGGKDATDFIQAMVGVSVENFISALDLIDSRFGSLSSYIENQLGFTRAEQEQLRNRYLEN